MIVELSSLNWIEVLLIGVALSFDSFSAALALGFRSHTRRDVYRFAFASGLAEAFVALSGALAGAAIVSRFESVDHWISFALLGAVSLHMFYEAYCDLRGDEDSCTQIDFHSFKKILVVSFATSLDALAVGVGLGSGGKTLTPYIFSIGLWAFLATVLGMFLARKVSARLGPLFHTLGAVVLMALAFKFLLTDL